MRLTAAILFLCCAATAGASGLRDYKQRLDRASDEIVRMQNSEDRFGGSIVASVIQSVPVSERVEWPGGSVQTDNTWLTAELDRYKAARTSQERSAILNGIRERLQAESRAIEGLQRATSEAPSKDSDKQKLAEILNRPEYQPPVANEESLFQKWWREFWEWIEGLFPKPQIKPSSPGALGSIRVGLQVLVFAIVAALLAFILWRFLPYFRARLKGGESSSRGDRVILGEIVGSDESASDIFSEAERLAREGDLRGAIRKGYIAVLCELGDRRLLRLARHKTNGDYLRDVRRNPNVFNGLRGLTDNFEQNWYGIRAAAPEDWQKFREGYDQTLREARG